MTRLLILSLLFLGCSTAEISPVHEVVQCKSSASPDIYEFHKVTMREAVVAMRRMYPNKINNVVCWSVE